MISKIIHDYLRDNKRITVPGFGSFIRKENGELAFVEILRGDDGVLSNLVRKQGQYSEVEAAAIIDRFIFEIKHAIQTKGSIRIKDLGTMSSEPGGKLSFKPERVPCTEVPPRSVVEKPVIERPVRQTVPPYAKTPPQRPDIRKSDARQVKAPKRRNTPARPNKKGTDTLLILAIIMALIALAVMIYGFSVSEMPELKLLP